MAVLKHALVLATICSCLVAASFAQDSPAPDPTSGDGSGNALPAVSLNVTVEAAAQAAGLGPTAAAASLNVNIGGGDGSWGSANAVVIADAGYVFDQSVGEFRTTVRIVFLSIHLWVERVARLISPSEESWTVLC
jgi:hypothetical protein